MMDVTINRNNISADELSSVLDCCRLKFHKLMPDQALIPSPYATLPEVFPIKTSLKSDKFVMDYHGHI
ncbi:hypothetical protein [Xenorhabdus anantnagensis]|uniref:Uncharacterized protein n=1 Tax=Xenorhabdus anantnagensis TaxID=3025875 RepID=A0ABT5LQJ0_9GAMM|nr:hypothetical protein [Xenorhabdus anantnagensis]MDC9596687.1 hypothetical protein [Xenorhabdus anantnagensis]